MTGHLQPSPTGQVVFAISRILGRVVPLGFFAAWAVNGSTLMAWICAGLLVALAVADLLGSLPRPIGFAVWVAAIGGGLAAGAGWSFWGDQSGPSALACGAAALDFVIAFGVYPPRRERTDAV